MKKSLFLLLTLLVSTAAFSQSAVIKGTVSDTTSHSNLEGADVFLLGKDNKKTGFHTRTTGNGFLLQHIPGGNYRMVVAATGYASDTTVVSVKNGDSIALNVIIKPAANELDGVIVKSSPKPITVRGDTVAFHADAFAVRPNAQLEDLLRKLPGIDVDKDGNITMQGEKIDKITVNGKDFFLGNIKQANSLPAEMISSIEAFGTQSDRAKFSGVKDNSRTKTLNIKTKKGMDQAWFGNAYASKGQGDSYAAGGLFTRFGGERMLMGNLKLNNINNRFLGVENKNMGPQSGIQSTAAFNINYREKWGKKWIAAFSFNGDNQKMDVLQSTSRRSFFTDSSLQENRLSQSSNKSASYPANLSLIFNADSLNQFQLTSNFSIQRSNNSTQDTAATSNLLNSGESYLGSRTQTDNSQEQNSWNLTNQLEWRHRFGKVGRSLQWSVSQSAQTASGPGSLYSVLNTFEKNGNPLSQTVMNQRFSQNSTGNGYGTSVMYTEPLSANHNLSLTYAFNTQRQNSDKRSNDYDSTTGLYDKPNPLTTNRFNNRNTNHRVEGSFGMNGKNINYQLGLGWQYSILDNMNYSPDRQTNQHFTNFFPRAMLNVNIGKGKSLGLNYNGNSTAPSIEQLQPLPDLTNPLFVRTGNPDLKQSFNHSISANLNSFNMKSFNGIMVAIQADMTQNQIVSSTNLLAGGVQEQLYDNVNGTYHLGSMASYSFGLGNKKEMKNSGSVSTHLRYGHDVGLVNKQENISNSFTWGQMLKLNYSIGRKFISELAGGLDYSGYRYSVRPEQNTQSWSQNATLNLSYELPLGINVQGSYSWMRQGTSGLLPSQSTSVLNAAIFKRLFAKQQWQVRLSGFDLLNTNRNYTQSAADNYIFTRQTNQLQRMFLLSLVYDFKLFPGLKKGGMSPMAAPYMMGAQMAM